MRVPRLSALVRPCGVPGGGRRCSVLRWRPFGARAGTRAAQHRFDLIIEHGRVIDGTGAPWYAADIGIRAGRIAAIGRLGRAKAKQRIDARGRIVAPGSSTCSASPS